MRCASGTADRAQQEAPPPDTGGGALVMASGGSPDHPLRAAGAGPRHRVVVALSQQPPDRHPVLMVVPTSHPPYAWPARAGLPFSSAHGSSVDRCFGCFEDRTQGGTVRVGTGGGRGGGASRIGSVGAGVGAADAGELMAARPTGVRDGSGGSDIVGSGWRSAPGTAAAAGSCGGLVSGGSDGAQPPGWTHNPGSWRRGAGAGCSAAGRAAPVIVSAATAAITASTASGPIADSHARPGRRRCTPLRRRGMVGG
jgi:hypothetical protein